MGRKNLSHGKLKNEILFLIPERQTEEQIDEQTVTRLSSSEDLCVTHP